MKMQALLLGLVFGGILGTVATLLVSGGTPAVTAACDPDGCADPPCCNGDANGDGNIDVADAVVILSYLFASGPQPSPIAPACNSPGLPATGQTLCYDDLGNAIDCAGTEPPGQDGRYRAGCPSRDRFSDNGDGTVTDRCTGLMWQRATGGRQFSLSQALRYCADLELAGHTDWRVPNVRELESLLDYARFDVAIDPAFESLPAWYWSSTTFAMEPSKAWIIEFVNGRKTESESKSKRAFVRAVRGGLAGR
jgi:hypothetical protein